LIVHRDPRSTTAEAYRATRTSLNYASATEPLRLFMITSASPGEGKTTNAVNLAISFAQSGARTLLVDADMRRPRIHRIMDVQNPYGLSSYLARSMPLEDVVEESAVPNLFVLPTGPLPPNPSEMLGSEAMKKFLAEVREQFDRIVIDTPPTAAVTDACVLAPLADGLLQVVLAGATSRRLVNRGKRQLLQVRGNHLGLILNGVKTRRHGYDYYYSGYYYYRYYGDKKKSKKRHGSGNSAEEQPLLTAGDSDEGTE
jgi:capsular exopolysaccharide synthesis family protein